METEQALANEASQAPDANAEENWLPPLRGPLIQSIRLVIALTLLTGVVYPLVTWVIAQGLFPINANGSLLAPNGQVIGSTWIGQQFDDPRYFWGRPSATAPTAYNAASSSGSNLGANDTRLSDAVQARINALRAVDPNNTALVPVDLVTTSGSGLDPHISPAAALYQVRRVARVRGLPEAQVETLVRAAIEDRQFGFLGEPRVNVLALNLTIDRIVANSP